jgi:hypothetical protein
MVYGENYQQSGDPNDGFNCHACGERIGEGIGGIENEFVREGCWEYVGNHADVRVHHSRGFDYHLGKLGVTGRIQVHPRFLLSSGNFLSPETLEGIARHYGVFTGYGQPALKQWQM